MPIYRIDSPRQKNGSAWDRTYRTRREAVAAIAHAYQMSETCLGPAFCGSDDDNETSWCVYDSREARDRDDTGAWAPRVTRCRK